MPAGRRHQIRPQTRQSRQTHSPSSSSSSPSFPPRRSRNPHTPRNKKQQEKDPKWWHLNPADYFTPPTPETKKPLLPSPRIEPPYNKPSSSPPPPLQKDKKPERVWVYRDIDNDENGGDVQDGDGNVNVGHYRRGGEEGGRQEGRREEGEEEGMEWVSLLPDESFQGLFPDDGGRSCRFAVDLDDDCEEEWDGEMDMDLDLDIDDPPAAVVGQDEDFLPTSEEEGEGEAAAPSTPSRVQQQQHQGTLRLDRRKVRFSIPLVDDNGPTPRPSGSGIHVLHTRRGSTSNPQPPGAPIKSALRRSHPSPDKHAPVPLPSKYKCDFTVAPIPADVDFEEYTYAPDDADDGNDGLGFLDRVTEKVVAALEAKVEMGELWSEPRKVEVPFERDANLDRELESVQWQPAEQEMVWGERWDEVEDDEEEEQMKQGERNNVLRWLGNVTTPSPPDPRPHPSDEMVNTEQCTPAVEIARDVDAGGKGTRESFTTSDNTGNATSNTTPPALRKRKCQFRDRDEQKRLLGSRPIESIPSSPEDGDYPAWIRRRLKKSKKSLQKMLDSKKMPSSVEKPIAKRPGSPLLEDRPVKRHQQNLETSKIRPSADEKSISKHPGSPLVVDRPAKMLPKKIPVSKTPTSLLGKSTSKCRCITPPGVRTAKKSRQKTPTSMTPSTPPPESKRLVSPLPGDCPMRKQQQMQYTRILHRDAANQTSVLEGRRLRARGKQPAATIESAENAVESRNGETTSITTDSRPPYKSEYARKAAARIAARVMERKEAARGTDGDSERGYDRRCTSSR